jgi:hypothetical protein
MWVIKETLPEYDFFMLQKIFFSTDIYEKFTG